MPFELLKTSISAVPDPMMFINEDGVISVVNSAAEALFGQWIARRSYVTALRQPGLLQQIEDAFRHGQSGETRFLRSDQTGETVYNVVVTPVNRREVELKGVLLHLTDITHLREAEEMRSNFVANVSHELRTPLTALMGFIETLRGPARNDEAARDRFLGVMEEEAMRMNRLVSDLLSLSRVEAEERMRPSEDVDLRQVIDGAVATLRPQVDEGGNQVEIVKNGSGFRVRGDKDQLTQVFLNLIENALKYGGRNKAVTLTLSRAEGRGTLKGPLVRIDIADQGDGIDPIHLPRLTERFYRIDQHRSRAMGGTGLGLAIVKHIVNRHRGRMRIASDMGQGSTFTILLPMH